MILVGESQAGSLLTSKTSDWMDANNDLSLHLVHMHFVRFF